MASALLAIVAMRGYGSENEGEIRAIVARLEGLRISEGEQGRTVEIVRGLQARLAELM
jgi:hypothetical protein